MSTSCRGCCDHHERSRRPDQLNPAQLRELATRLMAEVRLKQALIDKLTHEMATLKRLKFSAASEAFTGERQQLLFETIETDLAVLAGYRRSIGCCERLLNAAEPTFEILARIGEIDPNRPVVLLKSDAQRLR